MLLLLLCVVLQALSLSQGLNGTDDRTSKSVKKHADHSDKQIELSKLSLSEGCFGVLRALYKNTTVDVTLNLLDAQEKKELALQICERLSCGRVFEHGATATVHNGTCLADCILRDSKLHNCTTAAKGDCMNATEVICEHQAVRLVGGRDHCAGRVELLHSGNWGTVCDDDFDICSRHVVCAQLRCGSAIRMSFFGPGTGPIHISQMKCNGSESSLWECTSINTTASNYCGHKEDAGIVCSESVEITLIDSTTELNLTTLVPVSTAMAATESSSGVSAAAIGCVVLSIALLMVIILNAASYVHFKRAKECVIHQHHSNSHTSLESQSNVQIGIYNTQTVPAAGERQYESLGPRMSSKYGNKFSTRTNRPTRDSDSSTDSDYEHHNSNRPQRLHLNNSRDVNDVDCTSSGERRVHNMEINMDTIQKSGDKPPLTPLSFGAPDTHRQAVDMNDTSSTSSGEFYQNTKTDMDDILQSSEETPALQEKLPLTLLSYGDHRLPGTDNKGVDMNDSSSTSSGEFYQNTETNTDNNFMSREERPSLHEKSSFAPLSYSDLHFPNTDSQDVNDSDSTSSGECYQNTEIDMDNGLQCEDEESPSLPEKTLQTPHSTQMTGNTAGYSSSHVPITHSQDGNDSDSTSSEECYQNTEMDENAYPHYGEENPSLPEMSFQNPHIAQMTEGTDGYGDHHVPRNLSQETDNSSTASEASYVNVPPKKEREDHSAASSESDYDEPGTW
ncbi:T-cell differentiation antigen CD6-like isoform X1 [Sinocyclocheilus anshuiensis]|uniref:T-cell differentiation antigen CD6-like isoform X1 n=1 Tax=Sinocyclocheilus anshuiensis TaxID=1608454 RepID=UPI0007BA1DF1|nr:PREDICTED: T-cell differentiation antigen CD6-like isoform X1 [Sinocyclocheilus anshuiensis]